MGTMVTRCEYCGQLFDGLSCPHCCAPIGDDVSVSHNVLYADSVPYWVDGMYPVNTEITDIDMEATGDGNVQVIGDKNVVSTHEHWTDDWAKWSEQIDPEWNPEEDPENVDYFLVDIDPYKDEQVPNVGVPKPVEVEGESQLEIIFGIFASILILGLLFVALMLFWWPFSKL